MKILILCFVYNRPHMVRNAFQSVFEQSHKDWELAIIDDSTFPLTQHTPWEDYFKEDPRAFYIRVNDSTKTKCEREGSNFGRFANAAMLTSDADLCLMLCDDDALTPGYLERVDLFFRDHPTVQYAYSPLKLVNPIEESYANWISAPVVADGYLNWGREMSPFCQLDSSQVVWRLPTGARFPHPQTANLDANFYAQLHHNTGQLCQYMGPEAGQFKGWDYTKKSDDVHIGQLGKRHNPYEGTE